MFLRLISVAVNSSIPIDDYCSHEVAPAYAVRVSAGAKPSVRQQVKRRFLNSDAVASHWAEFACVNSIMNHCRVRRVIHLKNALCQESIGGAFT